MDELKRGEESNVSQEPYVFKPFYDEKEEQDLDMIHEGN
jgi:hypothetical protein